MGDSLDYANELAAWCQRTLERVAGHVRCQYLGQARYIPESQSVVCGCGLVADAPVVADSGTTDSPALPGGTVTYEARDPIESTLALIDPTAVATPDQLNSHILDVLARLECGAKAERVAIEAAAQAALEFDRRYWAEFDSSNASSDGKRKAAAMVACDRAGLTERKWQAEMVASALKATMHNLRGVLSGYQTVMRSVMVTYQAGGAEQAHYR